MAKEEVLNQLDHPFFMVVFGITPVVVGIAAFMLWGAKNLNRKGSSSSPWQGLTRVIQQP